MVTCLAKKLAAAPLQTTDYSNAEKHLQNGREFTTAARKLFSAVKMNADAGKYRTAAEKIVDCKAECDLAFNEYRMALFCPAPNGFDAKVNAAWDDLSREYKLSLTGLGEKIGIHVVPDMNENMLFARVLEKARQTA